MKWLARSLPLAALAAALLFPGALCAQSDLAQASKAQQQKQDQKNEAQKARVWTNEDLPKATAETVSVVGTPAPPPATAPGKKGEGEQASAEAAGAKPAAAAKPASPEEIKAAEDRLEAARKDLSATQTSIQILQERLASETDPTRREQDTQMLQRAQGRVSEIEATVAQAEKDVTAAKGPPPQGKAVEAESQAPPVKPPASVPQ